MNEAYLDAFVREAEESIVELNNALLALEDDPDDGEAMDDIFRRAHTLKGNCGAMGFDDASRLAHAVEDLLDEIRNDRLAVTPEIMDLVFEGVDLIEDALEGIEADGEPSIDPDPVIDEIRASIETASTAGDEGGCADGPVTASDALAAVDPGAIEEATPPIVHVRAELGGDMPGVDGTLLVESVTGALELVDATPPVDAIRDGEYDGAVDLFVAGDDPSTVEAAVDAVGPVSSTIATDVTDERRGNDDPADDGTGTPDAAPPEPETATVDDVKSVRIDVDQLDTLYGLVEQLVTSRIKLRQGVEDADLASTGETIDELDKISSNLQDTVMDMRMIPLETVVGTFPRMVRDLAREQGKEVDFVMENTDVELDRTILDEVSDPLLHVLRNAVDHGIEPPDEREANDKPREGTVRLRAEQGRDRVRIVVEDDGGGLDVAAIRETAIENGSHTEAELEAMDDGDVYDLVFHPGFSTSEEITDVSGRGVGMDVVSSTVDRLDGTVSVDSTLGEGTTVAIELPVTVAIARVLFVEVDGNEYGVPIKAIDEIGTQTGIETINGREAVDYDGDLYPLVRLREALDGGPPLENGDGMLLRIRETERQVALLCDGVRRIDEVVVKPLEGELRDVSGLGGTSVVGDGNVVPIVDVRSL